jgi:archaemetzincin
MFHDAGVLGFTSADISTTHRGQKDWGIFGLANSWLGTCVVSTFRLKHGNPEPEVFNRRVGIVAMHELGHLRGLPHCENQECVMQDCAGTIKTVDKKMLGWCENCRCKE